MSHDLQHASHLFIIESDCSLIPRLISSFRAEEKEMCLGTRQVRLGVRCEQTVCRSKYFSIHSHLLIVVVAIIMHLSAAK